MDKLNPADRGFSSAPFSEVGFRNRQGFEIVSHRRTKSNDTVTADTRLGESTDQRMRSLKSQRYACLPLISLRATLRT